MKAWVDRMSVSAHKYKCLPHWGNENLAVKCAETERWMGATEITLLYGSIGHK